MSDVIPAVFMLAGLVIGYLLGIKDTQKWKRRAEKAERWLRVKGNY